VLEKMLPARLKRWLQARLDHLLQTDLARFRAELSRTMSDYLRTRTGGLRYFAHEPEAPVTVTPRSPAPAAVDPETGLPLPPQELWAGYGSSTDIYLSSGKIDVRIMREVAARGGQALEEAGRVLELGCSAGRLIRWLHDLAGRCEVWGVDITAGDIHWCRQFLSPPFHFAVTTSQPHLPFEDRYFGFVYAGSVFTHLDDLAYAWFQELRRVVRPGGRLYVTIHDRNTVQLLKQQPWMPLSRYLASRPEYAALCDGDFGVLALKGDDWNRTLVFHDIEYLCRLLQPFFRTLSVNPGAYGYQTALLLERL
jgi:SAM-dependent methyltransferase